MGWRDDGTEVGSDVGWEKRPGDGSEVGRDDGNDELDGGKGGAVVDGGRKLDGLGDVVSVGA